MFLQAIEHPRAAYEPDIVRMDVFYSMWRSRTIPDPKGGSQPACETVLLHHEQFKIQERLARFAVKAGMNGFVKKLGPDVRNFVDQRRKKVQPVSHCLQNRCKIKDCFKVLNSMQCSLSYECHGFQADT